MRAISFLFILLIFSIMAKSQCDSVNIQVQIEQLQNETCEKSNGRIRISASGGTSPYFFAWNNTVTGPVNENIPAGIYYVTVTDANFCKTVDTIEIINIGQAINLYSEFPDYAIIEGDSIQINTFTDASILSIEWKPATNLSCTGCLNPVVSPGISTVYSLTVTDSSGCSATIDIPVRVVSIENSVFIPTAFSPNGDLLNDVFYIRSDKIVSMRLRIYDRWGKEVFTSDDINIGWDGTDNQGQPLNSGIYVYLLEALFTNGISKTYTGDVALLR